MIVLNGGSSSGNTGIARCLQAVLPDPRLVFGVDTLIQALDPLHVLWVGVRCASSVAARVR